MRLLLQFLVFRTLFAQPLTNLLALRIVGWQASLVPLSICPLRNVRRLEHLAWGRFALFQNRYPLSLGCRRVGGFLCCFIGGLLGFFLSLPNEDRRIDQLVQRASVFYQSEPGSK